MIAIVGNTGGYNGSAGSPLQVDSTKERGLSILVSPSEPTLPLVEGIPYASKDKAFEIFKPSLPFKALGSFLESKEERAAKSNAIKAEKSCMLYPADGQ